MAPATPRRDNGGPTDGGHSNTPLRGGKLNFFEGGVRPAAFITSPLLPAAVVGSVYRGIVHEVDWFRTFLGLSLGSDRSSDSNGGGFQRPLDLELDGMDVWPALRHIGTGQSVPHRNETLISDKILRVGKWKLVAGASHGSNPQNWWTANLKG